MLKSLSILICLITINHFGYLTPVQSVCNIELNNGEIVEGFLPIYNSNYHNYFERGFVTTYENREQEYFFSLNFKGFEIVEKYGGKKYTNTENGVLRIMEELFFIEYEIENTGNERSFESKFDRKNKRLTQRTEEIRNYIILDSIRIYQQLPKNQNLMNIAIDEQVKFRKIATKDIKMFKLDKTPSDKWKNQIKRDIGFMGFGEIWWYHEVLNKETEEQKSIRKTISSKLKE
jgi:hypothetical protein